MISDSQNHKVDFLPVPDVAGGLIFSLTSVCIGVAAYVFAVWLFAWVDVIAQEDVKPR